VETVLEEMEKVIGKREEIREKEEDVSEKYDEENEDKEKNVMEQENENTIIVGDLIFGNKTEVRKLIEMEGMCVYICMWRGCWSDAFFNIKTGSSKRDFL